MNRFKFRVWSFLDKSFHYFTLEEGIPSGIGGGVSEPQQFTGLTDKNGKEIYEGDILDILFNRCGQQICEVKWDIYGFAFYLVPDKDILSFPTSINDRIFECQIIGNNFQNK